jgi:short subunit dehydrogenase-like uncharacterized protein
VQADPGAGGLVEADSGRPQTVDRMVRKTRVLLTTAGPYARYGDPVVDACAEHGTDYVDITGEVAWVRRVIDRHHARAAADGTRLIPLCGFDSAPSDLGTLLTATHLRQRFGEDTRMVSASFAARGGVSGGTLATGLDIAEAEDPRALSDVLLLNPREQQSPQERARSADLTSVRYDEDREVWLSPSIMAPINTRVVRRSNALLAQYGQAYGPRFTYEEALEHRSRWAAHSMTLAFGAMTKAMGQPLGRRILRRLGPAPGQGPSEKKMDDGFVRVRLVAESEGGRKLQARLKMSGDPGHRVTVAFLTEAALALASDREALPGGPQRGGVLTPATGLGMPLLERMQRVGLELEVKE